MAGKKISRANMQRIQQIADHAYAMGARGPQPDTSPIGKAEMSLNDQLEAVARTVYRVDTGDMGYCYVEETFDDRVILALVENGMERYYQAAYTMDAAGAVTLAGRDTWVEVAEVWQPVTSSAKGLGIATATATAIATMKALGDRQIEVTVAYGGQNGGRDSHGEYFSPNTDFDAENFPAPPLLYYHGFDEQGKKMGKPVVTGKMLSRRAGPTGHVLVYHLKHGTYAERQWQAALKGECAVSPGTVGHLIRKASDGELLYWPLAEVSAWDYAPNRKQANLYSVAAPVVKAHYLAAGLPVPTPVSDPPEAAGDAASAVTIDDPSVKQVLAREIAHTLLTLRQGT